MTLKRKILAGFLVIVLLGVLQSVIGSIALTQVRDDVDDIKRKSAPLARAAQLAELEILKLTHDEHHRLIEAPDRSQLKKAVIATKQALRNILAPLRQTGGDGEAADELKDAVERYGDAAEALTIEIDRRKGNVSATTHDADELKKLVGSGNTKIMGAYCAMVAAERGYRATVDPLTMTPSSVQDAQQTYRNAFTDARREMNTVGADAADGAAIGDKLGEYHDAFMALLENDMDLAKRADSFRVAKTALQGALAGIRDVAGDDIGKALTSLYARVRVRVICMVAAAFAGVLFGSVIAFALVNEIIKPLRSLREATNRISLGELDVELEEPKTDDEIAGLTRSFRRMVSSIRALIQQEPP